MQSRMLFLVAILMGIITTAIFFYSTQVSEPEVVEEEVELVSVVQATQVISENQIISEEDVEVVSVPAEQAHSTAIQSTDEIVGQIATTTIEAGEVMLEHRLRSEMDETQLVSRKVQEGYRGVSIGVDIVRSVSNLIDPEDYVDVVLTYEDDEDEEDVSEVLLEEVRVLAVGRELVANAAGEQFVEYSSMTLELDQGDSVELVNADERGSIHFIVHSRNTSNNEDE
ncbi:Flp pilus assembly protein CpaB [Alkalibacillus haloalkaliphilus]|uniref:Flp pilus assembly protein CpaB n=1 Tax=Alkalibacillus haloalkaliphilus TaxID=94136 RepID=UPI00293662D9|nr:Flp pilus assembly protein CpaB [Alkalibacillus haloalkaliphilus]MDV2581343.1 Flp pilus assembly protein CpaB [Alkalibacillus haloalkaliphilus]